MTREELASLGSSKVRKDNALFNLFKKYITEDAAQLFSSGRLPNGCFSCQYSQHFRVWSNYILKDNIRKNNNMENYSRTYELEKPAFKVYFKGSVLSADSTDGEWIEWINYAEGDAKKARLEKFSKLPDALKVKKGKKKTEPVLEPETIEEKEEETQDETAE